MSVFLFTPFLILLFPVVLVVGVFLIARGAVGKMRLSEPRCAKCKYDLRAHRFWESAETERRCPECGSDLMADDAVSFGRSVRRPRLMLAGLGLLAIPAMLLLTAIGMRSRATPVIMAGPMGNSTKTNAVLIAELPKNAMAPWHWQELEARLKSGRLTTAETQQVIDALIATVDKARLASGQSQPMHWSNEFLTSADQSGQVSGSQYQKLVSAFYGPDPKLTARDRVVEGRPLNFSIQWGGPWNLPKTKFVKALREARVGDKAVTVQSRYSPQQSDPDYLSEEGSTAIWGKIPLKLKPGVYDLSFVLDAAALDDSTTLVGIDNKPGQKSRWKDVRATMEATVPLKLTVLPAGQEVVELVTDPAMDPVAAGAVKRPRLIVLKSSGINNVRVDVIFGEANAAPVPVIGQWYVRVGSKEETLSSYAQIGKLGGWRSQTYRKPFPKDLDEVDLVFKPSITDADSYPEVSKIWGNPIVFEKVPLERHDRPEATKPAATE